MLPYIPLPHRPNAVFIDKFLEIWYNLTVRTADVPSVRKSFCFLERNGET